MAKNKLTLEDVLVPKEEIPYEVPDNWCWVKLGNLVDLERGITFPASAKRSEMEEGLIPCLRTANVQSVLEIDDLIYVDKSHMKKNANKLVRDGDLIMSTANSLELVGKLAIVENVNQEMTFGGFVLNIRNKGYINNKYLFYYLRGMFILGEFQKIASQTTNIANINAKKIEGINIAIPPLDEQVRIINRIESLFDKVDKASELVDEARDGFEKRRAAILERAFSGELTKKWREDNGVSDEWKTVEFKELGKLERGRSKHRPRNDERLFGGAYPFIQTGDIANSNGYIYHHKQTLSEFGLEQSRLFPKGTLCITIAANIGDVAILTYDCCFPDSVVGFTPNDDIESKFIYYYLNLIKRDLEHYAPATAQKNINLAILGALDIPKPSIEEQRQIVEILEKSLDNESKVEDLIDLDDNIDLIKKSILAKSFRGELASNDLNEDSSIELIKDLVK